MKPRKGRLLAWGSVVVGMVVLLACAFLSRDRLAEWWYIRKFQWANETEKWALAKELESLGVKAKGAVEQWYINRFTFPDIEQQKRACKSLAQLRSVRAVPPLVQFLVRDSRDPGGSEHHLAGTVASALARIGPQAIPCILNVIDKEAASSQGFLLERPALESTKISFESYSLVDILMRLEGEEDKFSPLPVEPDMLVEFFKSCTGGEGVWRQRYTMEYNQGELLVSAPQSLQTRVQSVVKKLGAGNPVIWVHVARRASLSVLLDILRENEVHRHWAFVALLAKQGETDRVVPAISPLLQDEDETIRAMAAWALEKIRSA